MTDTTTLAACSELPQHPAPCELCYEDISASSSSMFQLSRCAHSCCHKCFTTWIAAEEASGKTSAPVCPFCRLEISAPDVVAILGRPYQPCSRSAADVVVEVDDDLTRQWLQEQTRRCAHCGAGIEKVAGGCDKMECLCGYRFCYGCGASGAECDCTPWDHFFWDNIVDDITHDDPAELAPVHPATGCIDLKNHIVQRQRRHRQQIIGERRAYRRCDMRHEEEQMDDTYFSARWLYCQRVQSSYIIMDKLTQATAVRKYRMRLRTQNMMDMERLEDTIWAARWLFCKDAKRGCRILNEQVQQYRKQRERMDRRGHAECHEFNVFCYGGCDTQEYVASLRALFGGWPSDKQLADNIRLVSGYWYTYS